MNALALVIGNADYPLEKHKLDNAVNDAQDISQKLWDLGFIVKSSYNCNGENFSRIVTDFGKELKNYDVGLFYFAGHGFQLEGQNFLSAIDTNFEDDVSGKHTSIPLELVIGYMQKANPKIKILILDACRDNPFPKLYRSTLENYLAPINAPKGTIIAFSTSPGERALDGGSERNSIYTKEFLNHIDDPNIPIEEFFKRVRTSVFTLSGGKQTSWEHSSLIGDFYFNSKQLVQSVDLPYRHEYIADENFVSDGSDLDEIINGLKSHDYYTQKPAIQKFRSLNVSQADESQLFLIGRNLLQTAVGGEFSAQSIFTNLSTWLEKYSNEDGENHVLNGILFEIYFNSKGQFRQERFKSDFNEEIFQLQDNPKFKTSFEFIQKQLIPFHEFLFYIPTIPSKALPIEITFEKYELYVANKVREDYKVISIKNAGEELMVPYSEDEWMTNIISYKKFEEDLCKQLCVPKSKLRLSMNFDEKDLKRIETPFPFKLSRDPK